MLEQRHAQVGCAHTRTSTIYVVVPFSGKYWQSFKFGALTVFRKSAKFNIPLIFPAVYIHGIHTYVIDNVYGIHVQPTYFVSPPATIDEHTL